MSIVTDQNNLCLFFASVYGEDGQASKKQKELTEQTNSNQIRLHVKDVNKKVEMWDEKIGNFFYQTSDLEENSKRNETLEALKSMKKIDFGDTVFTINST